MLSPHPLPFRRHGILIASLAILPVSFAAISLTPNANEAVATTPMASEGVHGAMVAQDVHAHPSIEQMATALDLNIQQPTLWTNFLEQLKREYEGDTNRTEALKALETLGTNLDLPEIHSTAAQQTATTNAIAPAYIFARAAHVLSPTDLDHLETLRKILQLNQDNGSLPALATRWAMRAETGGTNAIPHAEYSLLLGVLDKKDGALREMKTALRLDPNNPAYRFDLARLLFLEERYAEALEHMRALVITQPDNHVVLHRYAWLLLRRPEVTESEKKQALRLVNRANQLTGYENSAYLTTQLQAFNLLEHGTQQLQSLRARFRPAQKPSSK